jgi:regulator of nonsense transcripts 2
MRLLPNKLDRLVYPNGVLISGATLDTGDGSDGMSEKSDDERAPPVDEEELEEDDDKPEDMDVSPLPSLTQLDHHDYEEEDEEVLFDRKVEPEVDEEFNREFSRMMSEALESRKATSKAAFDVEPPTVRVRTQPTNSDTPADPGRVQFAVLSRRNKQVFPRGSLT